MGIQRSLLPVVIATALLVAACGGGGSSPTAGTEGQSLAAASANVSGSIVKGPVAGSTVCAYQLVAGGKGALLGCTTTAADGSYSLSIEYTGPVVVEATGGTYTDEASGTPGVALAEPLLTVGDVGEGDNTLVATPLTALAYQRALAGGLSPQAYDAASAEVAATFNLPVGTDLSRTVPKVDGTVNPYGGALIGVSRMLGYGATLSGIVHNDDLARLKNGYQASNTLSCTPTAGASLRTATVMTAATPVPGTPNTVIFDGQATASGDVRVTVTRPFAAWRALLGEGATAMGCAVEENTAALVRLSCPASALQAGLIVTTVAANAPSVLPATGVSVAGDSVLVEGDVVTIGPPIDITTLPVPVNGTIGGSATGGVILPPTSVCVQATPVLDASGGRGSVTTTGGTGGTGTGGSGGAGGSISVGGSGSGGAIVTTGGSGSGGGTITIGSGR